MSSSSWCNCSATAVSSTVARRTMRRVASAGATASAPLQLPAHFFAATGPTADTRPRSCPRSTSTITESCRASGSADGQEKNSFRFPLNRTSMTSVNSLLAQRTHRKVLLLPAFEELLDPHLAQLPHMASQRVAQRRGGGLRIGVRSARRLGDDLVDDPELQQVFGRDLERLGGALPLARILPEDGGAALGGDDGVHGVLEHQYPVGESDGEGAARAALADDGGNDRRAERRHLHEIARDRLGLTALLGAEPGIRAGRVHQGDDGRTELLGQMHEAQRLAITLGVGHPEVAVQILLGVAALLVPDHHDAHAVEPRPAAHQGGIVAEQPVAVQLDEVREHSAQVVERVRSLGVAGHLDALHRRQVLVDLGAQLGEPLLERSELLGDVHRRLARDALQLLDLALQLEQRTLEVQRSGRHGQVVRTRWTCSGPSSARSATTRSSAASTRSERLRRRVTPAPGASPGTLSPFPCSSSHSTSTGAGPGWAAHSAAAARAASGGGGAPGDQRSAMPMAPLAFSSSSGCAVSTMNGACSSSRSRALWLPTNSSARSARITSFSLAQASGNTSASAVPWKSSSVRRAYSAPVFFEICRFTTVTTAATRTRWSLHWPRVAVVRVPKSSTSTR